MRSVRLGVLCWSQEQNLLGNIVQAPPFTRLRRRRRRMRPPQQALADEKVTLLAKPLDDYELVAALHAALGSSSGLDDNAPCPAHRVCPSGMRNT